MPLIKVLTLHNLTRLNNRAIKLKYGRTMAPPRLTALTNDVLYPVVGQLMLDDGVLVRCRIALSETTQAELDVPTSDFNALPSVTIPD